MPKKLLELDVDYVVCVSDTHAGSAYGLLPPSFHLHEGQRVGQNAVQKWLWACWREWWSVVRSTVKGHSWALVINGDCIEGIHHRSVEVISADVGDHKEAALALLREIEGQAHTVVVEGTECHTANTEHSIARELGAVPYGPTKPAWPQLDLDVRGCVGIIRHHIGVAIRPYLEASMLSIQLGTERVEAARMGVRPPQFLVSAHRHSYGLYDDGQAVSAVCPPWQALTRHGRKVCPAASTRVGGIMLDFRRAGPDDPPHVIRRIYTP